MVCVFLTITVPAVYEKHYFGPCDKAWNLLYEKGIITEV